MAGETEWQLSWYDVPDAVVRAPGARLEELLGRRPRDLDDLSRQKHPIEGWRLIDGPVPPPPFDVLTVLGAPWPAAGTGLWALLDVTANNGRTHASTTSPVPLRPGRGIRRQGLTLEWPAQRVEHPAGRPVQLAITVRNNGPGEWTGDGLDCTAVRARILLPDGTPLRPVYRWGGQQVRPLGPLLRGGLVDLTIESFDNAQTETLPPGEYLIEAELVDLKLISARVRITVTP